MQKAQRHKGTKGQRVKQHLLSSPSFPRSLSPSVPHFRNGFTLTEILIVIALIVLFITLALPAFNLISGGRSIAGGTNLVSAFIGRARTEAIGLQQTRGVAFYVDAATGKSTMAIVQQPLQSPNIPTTFVVGTAGPFTAGTYVTYGGRYYVAVQNLPVSAATVVPTPPTGSTPADDANWSEVDQYATDVAPDSDALPLPTGVGAQLINDNRINTSTGSFSSNHYVSYGAIVFDSTGTMVSKRMSLPHEGVIGQRINGSQVNTAKNLPIYTATPANDPRFYSQVGAVLFDLAAYNGVGGSMNAQSIFLNAPPLTALPASESTQETWLDHNSTPLLINRYNGTLIPAQ